MQKGVFNVMEMTPRGRTTRKVVASDYVDLWAPDMSHWHSIHPDEASERMMRGWTLREPEVSEVARTVEPVEAPQAKVASADKVWYEDLHKGQTIYVLGTGTSLTKEMGKKLMASNAITIGVNDIFRLVPPNHFVPTYHVHVDYSEQKPEEQFSNVNKNHLQTMQSRGTTLFIPMDNHRVPTCDLVGEYYQSIPEEEFITEFNYKEGILQLGHSASSIFQAIQLAVIMGANPIILLGVDYYIPRQGTGYKNLHFYEEYYKGLMDLDKAGKEKKARELEYSRKHLEHDLKKTAIPVLRDRKIMVLNGNKKSKLEAFTGIDIEDYL